MSDIRFADGKTYSREWLDKNDAAAQRILHHHRNTYPLCLCTPNGVPMYIREMSATGRCYLSRMPGTGPEHAVNCPSFEPIHGKAEQEALENGAIVQQPDGRIDFRLHLGFDVRENAPTPPEERRPAAELPQMVSDPPARLGLLALLQYLWEVAELHHWHPKMLGRRHYKQVQERLLAAADVIHVKGFPLRHRLFIPEPFRRERSQQIATKRLERLSQMARGASGNRRRFLVLGQIRKVKGNEDATRLHLAQVGNEFCLQIRTETWKRLCKRWNIVFETESGQEEERVDLKTWGLFLIDAMQNHVLLTRAAALMQTTEQYIPVFRPAEVALAYGLVESERHFIKMLSMDGRPSEGPAFMLTDCGEKAVPLYLISGEEIVETALDEWYWHTDSQDYWPDLPAARRWHSRA